jgi:hypothetical protein
VWANGGLYNDWVTFLDRWRAGEPVDPGGLPALAPEDFTGDSWERLVNHLTAALSQRLQSWADALTRALGASADEFVVARALTHARWGLQPIRALAGHPGLPADLTVRLLDAVDTQVRSAQRSLEDSVERMRRSGADRSAVEQRLRTVRDNALTGSGGPVAGGPPVGADAWAADPSATPRRRVILD